MKLFSFVGLFEVKSDGDSLNFCRTDVKCLPNSTKFYIK